MVVYLLPKPNTLPQPKHSGSSLSCKASTKNTEPKKPNTNTKYKFPYSKMTVQDTEERLGFMMQTFESEAVAVKDMLGKFKDDTLETGSGNLKTKEKVYDRIMEYLEAEGYPTEAEEDFKEANINDLVYGIISPIIADFRPHYVDDINPLIISNRTNQGHNKVVEIVNSALDSAAGGDELTWDPEKESRVDFHKKAISSCTTLGIHVRSNLSWDEHIKRRTRKAAQLLHVLTRLGNSNGGMSPLVLRSLYTGAVRPIFTGERNSLTDREYRTNANR
ncbi:hypothetical protein BGX38DRAFT_1334265 [Terfezia claveryi]|nr:hypothetical protein BGX38DRAFT_1334265 [Terfezia claveryi]